MQIPNQCNPFKMEHFKLKLDRSSIEHRRPSINVRSLLPSTNCVTKETISHNANTESFRAKMRDTPLCFPILTILYLVSNCLYFHVKWRKGPHFCCEYCRFVCFETGLGKPMLTLKDTKGFKKHHRCSFYLSRIANGIHLSNQRQKVKLYQRMSGVSRYTKSTYDVRKTASATRMDVRT